MTLQRRLLLGLLLAAGLLWMLAVSFYYVHARQEVDELFDTVQVRMAQQIRSTLSDRLMPPQPPSASIGARTDLTAVPIGQAELDDMTVTVWDGGGRIRLDADPRVPLPRLVGQPGFHDVPIGPQLWRIYYLPASPAPGQDWLIAVGFKVEERDEMLSGLVYSQMLYWFLLLPALALATWFVVRYAFRPLSELSANLARRDADDLTPITSAGMASDLDALVDSMNALFRRIETTLANERRLVADAAHELRTPLAALRAHFDAARLVPDEKSRGEAMAQIDVGLNRLTRLMNQLLSLARLDAVGRAQLDKSVDWSAVATQAINDTLPLLDAGGQELQVEWPQAGVSPMPLLGDETLLSLMLRNLLDNAARYTPAGTRITIRFGPNALEIEDDGPGMSVEERIRAGERFVRRAGQRAEGSGIGLSIVTRVAALHGLQVEFMDPAGSAALQRGLRVRLRRRRGVAQAAASTSDEAVSSA